MSGAPGERFIFKQSYKPRNKPSTKALNQKHLAYIATRPGVMKNEGCGFGLWGKLPGMGKIADIEDFGAARRTVGTASENHTIYRAILSVNKETAQQFNLYDRAEWEKLLRPRIDIIRRSMNIKKENFCWAAAMHYKKNHPHVHIMYWDNGNDPRQEHISKARFEAMSEEIRKVLTAALENEPMIRQLQSEQAELEKDTRLRLNAMLKESNLADVLDLDHIKPTMAESLGEELQALMLDLPKTGRLYYSYMNDGYKEKLDSFVEHVMRISDFSKLERQYLDYAADISEMYGNSAAVVDKRVEDAGRSLRKAMANELLKYLKEVKIELETRAPPGNEVQLAEATRNIVLKLLHDRPQYAEFLNALPSVRTPRHTAMNDQKAKDLMDGLVKELADDVRVRSKLRAFLRTSTSENASKEEKRAASKEASRTLFRAVGNTVWEAACEDKGYNRQQKCESAITCLLRLFRDASQEKNQKQAQRQFMRESYRNLSETARKDLRKKRQQEGSWSLEE